MKRYFRSAAIAVSTIAFAAVPVFADNTATNSDTGAKSDNTAVATSNVECSVDQTNQLRIVNEIVVISNSGGNTANNNTGDGSVDTGNASASVDVTNSGNSNDATVQCSNTDNSSSNTNTGANSNNTAVATSARKLKPKQENRARLANGVIRIARTGRNRANGNGGDGSVTTGGASGNTSVTNDPLNTNTSNVGP